MPHRWLALPLASLLLAPNLFAESKNPADYPLRLHVFTTQVTTFYQQRYAEESKGNGRADLYQNSEARGVDFTFECADPLRNSFGYETYPARWKKPGTELVVLLPKFGEAGSYWTCDIKTDVKDYAYAVRHGGGLTSESIADFKAWMVRRDYDPEHGKNTPVKVQQPAPGSTPAPTAPPSETPPPAASPQPPTDPQ